MTGSRRVTVLIPARNEEQDIAECIDVVGGQDYPLDEVQLIVVDGASDDRTKEVVRRASAGYPFGEVLVLDNPARRIAPGLNVGLERATGTFLARVDARARIPKDYLRTCEATLERRPGIGVVGGAQMARARSHRPVDLGIAGALRNRWATGLSRYRRTSTSGPSDTVWMGFFRTAELRALGGWASEFALNEDYELNARYRAAGKTVWFDGALRSEYLPRRSLVELGRQYFRFGRAKGTWWARGQRVSGRQLALLAAPPALATVVLAAGRRVGPASALLVPALLTAVERAGRRPRPDEPEAPLMASAAIAVVSGSWWVGVVTGFAGELAGVKHEQA